MVELELITGVIADILDACYAFVESWSNGKHELEWYNRRKYARIFFFFYLRPGS
jgi:hypothetical protein